MITALIQSNRQQNEDKDAHDLSVLITSMSEQCRRLVQ
ncbi:MAG: hypothetical protein ACI841_002877 [Planctomycetota bacterium]|jgi:hypothetical protein